MAEITKLNKHSQGTTRDKYKVIARAKAMSHGDLEDHVTSHMLGCCDDDCDICDLGQSGQMIDDDEEGEGKVHDIGSRSSRDRKGADSLHRAGEEAEKDTKGDHENLMKHGEHVGSRTGHSSKHPGFKSVARGIAGSQHVSQKAAARILASRTRSASPAAKKSNPRLARVRG